MATNTYVALDKVTVGTAVSTVTLSSINQGYTDLVVVVNPLTTASANMNFRYNSDTSPLYSDTYMQGDGTSALSNRDTSATFHYGSTTAITTIQYPVFILNVMNYSNTTTFKTSLHRYNNSGNGTSAQVNLYRSTDAITSIDFLTSTGNFAVGSTFSLYGIASSGAGAKATGGTVTSDSQYYYHTFLSSGTFTPTQSLTADYLVVAGGGGGGALDGGGGGAGGLRSTVTATGGGGSLETPLSLTATGYTVTVGGGGSGGLGAGNGGTNGTNGSDSVFSTITATGGGFGGSNNAGFGGTSSVGAPGGSGGGAGPRAVAAGAGTTNQGYAGGLSTGTRDSGGGGGGANAVGAIGVNAVAGAGGAGVATIISGSSTTYAGGGGAGSLSTGSGGAGGAGGGGTGTSTATVGGAGTTNTGGGGGGSGFAGGSTANGGAGGSGIVIVRYLKA